MPELILLPSHRFDLSHPCRGTDTVQDGHREIEKHDTEEKENIVNASPNLKQR